jgi:hypothetical protein
VENRSFDSEFFVMAQLNHPLYLGADFFQQSGAGLVTSPLGFHILWPSDEAHSLASVSTRSKTKLPPLDVSLITLGPSLPVIFQ